MTALGNEHTPTEGRCLDEGSIGGLANLLKLVDPPNVR